MRQRDPKRRDVSQSADRSRSRAMRGAGGRRRPRLVFAGQTRVRRVLFGIGADGRVFGVRTKESRSGCRLLAEWRPGWRRRARAPRESRGDRMRCQVSGSGQKDGSGGGPDRPPLFVCWIRQWKRRGTWRRDFASTGSVRKALHVCTYNACPPTVNWGERICLASGLSPHSP